MRLELKNQAVLIEFLGLNDFIETDRVYKNSGLILPDYLNNWYVNPLDPPPVSPVMIGVIRDMGPGRENRDTGEYDKPIGLEIGQRVLFQVENQIAFRKEGKIFYLAAFGNILGIVEED